MRCSITGADGFLGKTLKTKLENEGWTVFRNIRPDVDYVFLFGSASSHEQFKENMDKCFEDTIYNFLNAIQFCRDNEIKLIYPSSITASTKESPYARCKAALEEIQAGYGTDSLGLRIACGYGPNETHKDYYASVLYKFCKLMKKGERPVIWGDGQQTRDFIYQDDIVNTIVDLTLNSTKCIEEIGTGINTSFIELVNTINMVLNTNIEPFFIDAPARYVRNSFCNIPTKYNVSLAEGIERVLKSL